jgi:hypothetical protein
MISQALGHRHRRMSSDLKETACLSSLRFSLLADDTGIIQSIPAKQL